MSQGAGIWQLVTIYPRGESIASSQKDEVQNPITPRYSVTPVRSTLYKYGLWNMEFEWVAGWS